MADVDPLSLAELVASLSDEVSAVIAAQVAEARPRGLAVDSVRVNIGGEGGGGGIKPVPDDEPWQLEVRYGADDRSRPRIGGTVAAAPGFVSTPVLELPVVAIKGVNVRWRLRLNGLGYSTIGELAAKTVDDLLDAVPGWAVGTLLDLHGKALIVQASLPFLPESPADGQSLRSLSRLDTARLARLLGKVVVSAAQLRRFRSHLALLTVALDADVLAETQLGQLRVDKG